MHRGCSAAPLTIRTYIQSVIISVLSLASPDVPACTFLALLPTLITDYLLTSIYFTFRKTTSVGELEMSEFGPSCFVRRASLFNAHGHAGAAPLTIHTFMMSLQ